MPRVVEEDLTGPWNAFGSKGNIGRKVDDQVVLSLKGHLNTLGARIIPPAGGQVVYEGSFDGDRWVAVTLRNIEGDDYSQKTKTPEHLIGSIAVLRKLRFRTEQEGTKAGRVRGSVSAATAVLEGIENRSPPHQVGHDNVHHDVFVDSAVTGEVVWDPGDDHKFAVTTLFYSQSANNTVTVFDETDEEGKRLLRTLTSSESDSINFDPPYVSNAAGNRLRFTVGGAQDTIIIVHGYEIPVL